MHLNAKIFRMTIIMIKYYDQAINIFEEVKYCNFVAFIHHLWRARLPPHNFASKGSEKRWNMLLKFMLLSSFFKMMEKRKENIKVYDNTLLNIFKH